MAKKTAPKRRAMKADSKLTLEQHQLRWDSRYGIRFPTSREELELLFNRLGGVHSADVHGFCSNADITDMAVKSEPALDRICSQAARAAIQHLVNGETSEMPCVLIDDDAFGWVRLGPSDGEYQPASWFRKGDRSVLRQAARTNRKRKRVRTKRVDGTLMYSTADVRRWWPHMLPDRLNKEAGR